MGEPPGHVSGQWWPCQLARRSVGPAPGRDSSTGRYARMFRFVFGTVL